MAQPDRDINQIIAEPAFNKRLLEIGVEPMGGSVADFEKFLDSEMKKGGEVVRISGARLD